jgi:hypothetical protein
MAMSRAWRLLALALTLVMAAAAAEAEDLVVVRSTSGSLVVGQLVRSGTSITIPAEAQVALIGASGRIVKLSGPYTGVPSSGSDIENTRTDVLQSMRTLLTNDKLVELRGGASAPRVTRSSRRERDDLFAADVEAGGIQCVTDGSDAALIGGEEGVSAVSFRDSNGTSRARIEWQAGARRIPWPTSLPRIAGKSYSLTLARAPAATLQVVHIDSATKDIDTVMLLAQKNCVVQARFLLNLMADGT